MGNGPAGTGSKFDPARLSRAPRFSDYAINSLAFPAGGKNRPAGIVLLISERLLHNRPSSMILILVSYLAFNPPNPASGLLNVLRGIFTGCVSPAAARPAQKKRLSEPHKADCFEAAPFWLMLTGLTANLYHQRGWKDDNLGAPWRSKLS